MKGNDEVLGLLNGLLTTELTAVNMYLLQARMCDRWGYERLAAKFHEDSKEETAHADEIIARILFLEGTPNMTPRPLQVGSTVREQLESNLTFEREAVGYLNRAIERARAAGDNASEALMTKILVSEEEDVDWIESQLDLMRQVGDQNYLAQQLK
jgi:bacterioferritin